MMNEKEAIKALEVYYEEDIDMLLTTEAAKEILDLINRQQTEIERLTDLTKYQKKELDKLKLKYDEASKDMLSLADTCMIEIKEAKVEAVNEFAERLKARCTDLDTCNINEPTVRILYYAEETIDDVVKEMTEGGNND